MDGKDFVIFDLLWMNWFGLSINHFLKKQKKLQEKADLYKETWTMNHLRMNIKNPFFWQWMNKNQTVGLIIFENKPVLKWTS